MKRLRSLRGLSAQLLLFIVLPLFLILSAIALGSVFAHQRSMRSLVGERNLRAVRVAAAALSTVDRPYNEQHLQTVLSPLLTSPATTVILVDAQSRVVYTIAPQNASQSVGQILSSPGVSEALAGHSGLFYRPDSADGEEQVVAYAPVAVSVATKQASDWALVVEEPLEEVFSPWLQTSLLGPLILVPAVAAALVALWFAVQRVIRPLQRLDAEVTALGWGDFGAVEEPVGGIEEIQELQRALVRMATQVRAYQQSMRGYLGMVTAAQEDERKRLARELHDQTIQDLIALKQRVQAASRRATGDPAALRVQLAELQAMLDTTMEEVRRFSRALRPIYLEDVGLVAALETLARDADQDALHVTLDVEGHVRRLAPEIELALYRIVQEALNNALRHAQASRIWIDVEFNADVAIWIQDDGVGFAVPQRISDLAIGGHYGLMGMQERAQLVGAHLLIDSRPGAGTTLEIHLHPPDPTT
jgi:signal transduction histidine kinase